MEATAPDTSPGLLRQIRREVFDICTDPAHPNFAEIQPELDSGVSAWHLLRLPSIAKLCGPRFPYHVLYSALRDGTVVDFDQATHTVRPTSLERRLSSYVQSCFEDEAFAAHAELQAIFAKRRPDKFWPSELLFTLTDVKEMLPRSFTVDDDVYAAVARAFSSSEIVDVSPDGRRMRRKSDRERLKLHIESHFSPDTVAKDKWVQDALRRAALENNGYIKLSDLATWGRVRRLSSFLKPWEVRKNRDWKDSELAAVLETSEVVELHPDGHSLRWRGTLPAGGSAPGTPQAPRLNWSASSLPPPPMLTPLEAAVREVERAFGEANYIFDRRLQSLVASDPDGFVSISDVAQFDALDSADRDAAFDRLEASSVVELDRQRRAVRRRHPLPSHVIRTLAGDASGELSVMSYNVLADKMATLKDLFDYCSQEYLFWDNRRLQLEREITFYHADIVCLQEVQCTRNAGEDPRNHAQWFSATLGRHGYASVFRPRLRKNQDPDFGNMILWDTNKFDKLEHIDFEFRQLLAKACAAAALSELQQQHKRGTPPSSPGGGGGGASGVRAPFDAIRKLVDAEPFCQNAQIVHLRHRASVRDVFVVNTHLHIGKDDEKFLQVLQVQTLVQQLVEFIGKEKDAGRCDDSHRPAVVFCGDLNATPKSEVYQLLSAGRLPVGSPVASMRLPYAAFGHQFDFASAYCSMLGVELATNVTPQFVDTLDYVWYSRRTLRPTGVLRVPDLAALNELPGIPDAVRPSDHFSLLCHLAFEPS